MVVVVAMPATTAVPVIVEAAGVLVTRTPCPTAAADITAPPVPTVAVATTAPPVEAVVVGARVFAHIGQRSVRVSPHDAPLGVAAVTTLAPVEAQDIQPIRHTTATDQDPMVHPDLIRTAVPVGMPYDLFTTVADTVAQVLYIAADMAVQERSTAVGMEVQEPSTVAATAVRELCIAAATAVPAEVPEPSTAVDMATQAPFMVA